MAETTRLTLLVMAAGLGSRYGGLKQLDRLGPAGETIMDYAVFDAIRAGFTRVVFIINPVMETDFRAMIRARYQPRVDTACVLQRLDDLPAGRVVPAGREKPWGTGQAVFCARRVVDGPFAVVNADDFYGSGSYRLLADHLAGAGGKTGSEYAMCGFRLGNTLSEHGAVSRGICRVGADGFLAGITEHARVARAGSGARSHLADGQVVNLTGREIVSMNMWAFTPRVFSQLERLLAAFLARSGQDPTREFYIPEAVGTLLASGTVSVRVLPSDERWFGVTYREDRAAAAAGISALVASGAYPTALFP